MAEEGPDEDAREASPASAYVARFSAIGVVLALAPCPSSLALACRLLVQQAGYRTPAGPRGVPARYGRRYPDASDADPSFASVGSDGCHCPPPGRSGAVTDRMICARLRLASRAPTDAPMCCQGSVRRCAGSPVIGHSGEGRLVLGQAVRRWCSVTGRQIVRETTVWCQGIRGPVPSPRMCQRGKAP